jgi:hypothetical protein
MTEIYIRFMTHDELINEVQGIVVASKELSSKHTTEGNAPVNYACIFSQSEEEYDELVAVTREAGSVVQETGTGPVFDVSAIPTVAGDLRLLKIRKPDPKRSERGDADFTVSDYPAFKNRYFDQPGFSLIERENMEMIELSDPEFDVLAYYSHPPLGEVLGVDY